MTADAQQGGSSATGVGGAGGQGAGVSQAEVNPASAASAAVYRAAPVMRHEHRESSLTRLLEQQAAKVPSDVFLFSSLCALAAAAAADLAHRERLGRWFGLWVTPLLVMGVYTKMVKTFGAR
jgi:hypothetical protein